MSLMKAKSLPLYGRASVPQGMDTVLEGLTREVLKQQPRDIYLFAAEHFQELIRLRDLAAHSAGVSPSSTQDSDRLAPDSPLDLKERLLSDDDATPLEVGGDAPTTANGSAKTGNGVGIAAAGATTLLGAAAAVDEALVLAQQTREDVQKDAEVLVDEVVVEAEKEVEKITSPIPIVSATPDEIIITSPSPPSTPVEEEDRGVEETVESAAKSEENEDKPVDVATPEVEATSTQEEVEELQFPSASQSPEVNEEEGHSRGKRSVESAASGTEAEEGRPASVVEAEATSESRPASDIKSESGSRPVSEAKLESESRPASEAKAESESRPPSEAKSQSESRPVSQAKLESESRPVSETKAESESRPPSEAKSQSESRPASEAKAESESRPVSEAKPENESRPASEVKTERESRPPSEAKSQSESRPASEAKAESESRPASEPKPESESRPASEAKAESESRPPSEAKSQSESRPASEAKPESESRPPSEAKSQSESRPVSEAKLESESRPASEAKPESESRPPSEAKSQSESRPPSEVKSQSESRPVSEAKPESESRPPSEVKSQSESRPASEAKPESESRPPSEAKSQSESRPPSEAKSQSESRPASEAKPENESRPPSEAKSQGGSRPASEAKPESESRPPSEAKSQGGSRPVSEAKPAGESEPGDDITAAIEEAVTSVLDDVTAGTESPVVLDKEDIEQDTGATPVADADVVDVAEVSDVAVSAATTIQATFRGHQARQNLKKAAGEADEAVEETSATVEEDGESELQIPTVEITEEEFPPPLEEEVESDLTTTNEDSEVVDIAETIDDLLPTTEPEAEPEAEGGDSQDDRSTTRAESEVEICETPKSSTTLDVDDVSRTASNVSESTEDSVTALKGSETESVDALSRLSVAENEEQQDERSAASTETNGIDADLDKLETAATTIQATFRGFQTRKDLQRVADDAMLPPPEPSQDFLFGEAVDDDLPPPPDECDLEPPPPEEAITTSTPELVTPRSPETGEKVSRSVDLEQDDATMPGPPDDLNDETSDDPPPPPEEFTISPEELAILQRPTMCDELPEHRGGVRVNGEAGGEGDNDDDDEEGEDIEMVNGNDAEEPHECDEMLGDAGEVPKNEASSGEIDDSSLSSAATKIQAGTRGYLARKHMKDTFSTTAPSIADSQQSIGTVHSSQDDDDGVQTSGSVETEVQRHSMEDVENGIISVVISTATDKLIENGDVVEENIETVVTGKGMSLDSQLAKEEKKTRVLTSQSVQNPANGVDADDDVVWKTLHNEMEEAATKIQSNYRGFSARQKLHRGDAVQRGTTSSGTPATVSEESDLPPPPVAALQSSGEFHDMMVLPPASPVGVADSRDAAS